MFKLLFLFFTFLSFGFCDNIQKIIPISFHDMQSYKDYIHFLESQKNIGIESKFRLAEFYYNVSKEYDKAYYLFLELDLNNIGIASTYLGIMHYNGFTLNNRDMQDNNLAYKYFVKSLNDKDNYFKDISLDGIKSIEGIK